MKDRFFYPLAILVIAGILALALYPRNDPNKQTLEEMRVNGLTLKGEDLQRLVASKATLVNFVTDGVSGDMIAILSSNIARDTVGGSAGVFAAISPSYKEVFVGQRLKVTIVARKGSVKPLLNFDAGYFQTGGGLSGWQNFELSYEFKEYNYYYTPKPVGGKPSIDYAGIWPGTAGHSETMDVKSISIVIDPKTE